MARNYSLLVINYAINGLDGDMVFANEVNALLMKCPGREEGGGRTLPSLTPNTRDNPLARLEQPVAACGLRMFQ